MVVSGAGCAVVEKSGYDEPLLITSNGGEEIISTSSTTTSVVQDVVDYKGERVIDRSKFGQWRSASLIIVLDVADSFIYFGIATNLITYLTGPLRQSTVTAAANVNAWLGVTMMLPLLGAFVADSYLGCFHTILFSSVIHILGLGLLTLSVLLPSLRPPDCLDNTENNTSCGSPSTLQVIFFFFSLYLAAIGSSGYRPCAQAFGADQFDGRHPEECKSKSSFFNWWYFGLSIGSILSSLILNYIQDNLSWGLGFGISCISMIVALMVFLLGTKTYRYNAVKEDRENQLSGIAKVFIVAVKNWRATPNVDQEEATGMSHHSPVASQQFKFLDKALIDMSNKRVSSRKHGRPCSISQVEDAKAILRLIPIWTTCLVYAIVNSQSPTFFTKQSSTMDRSIGPEFQIPAASLQIFHTLSVLLFITIYDRLFVPFSRDFTGNPSGITMLQRIGGGMFLSTLAMVVAAIIEKKRLQTAIDFGLIDNPISMIPMKVWWLVPQYILSGLASVFILVGLQEFFYDQVPDGLRSVGLSLFASILGIGSFLSGFLISFIERVTRGDGSDGWFPDNFNQAHLDYFYWLLAGLSIVQLVAFLYFSKSYTYKRET